MGVQPIDGHGYALARTLATDNLKCGLQVVVDSVNPWELTREQWRAVATDLGLKYLEIEVVCSSEEEHRKRVEERESDIRGLVLPTWEQVLNRDYEPWASPRLIVNTAGKTVHESQEEIIRKVRENEL